jgi:SAM-dependent methyltransferase
MGEGKRRYYERGGLLDPALAARYYRLLGSAKVILDLGCGRGCLGRLKPSPEIEVHGLDHDPLAVEEASRYEKAVCLDLDHERLPYGDAAFEAAIAKDILEHLQDPPRVLREIRRVLRPGGRLLVSVPMEYPWVVWNDYTHVRGFTKDAIRLLLEDAGFDVLHVLPMGGVPLAGRLGLVDWIPRFLALPGARRWFGRSWEGLAIRAHRT